MTEAILKESPSHVTSKVGKQSVVAVCHDQPRGDGKLLSDPSALEPGVLEEFVEWVPRCTSIRWQAKGLQISHSDSIIGWQDFREFDDLCSKRDSTCSLFSRFPEVHYCYCH